MKITLRRPLAVVMLLFMALLLPGTAFAEEPAGYFYLMAATESKMIISPVRVEYEEGMSIREALTESGYEFAGITDGSFISAVEGYSASFSLFYDGGGFVLDEDASEITAIAFTEGGEYYSPDLIGLICLMGRYTEMTNNVQNYDKAREIYENALDSLRKPDVETVKAIYADLSGAIEEYEKIIGSEKHTVSFSVKKGEDILEDVNITLTDKYGNVTSVSGVQAQVVSGEYSFVVSDKRYNRVEGTLSVNDDMTEEVKLPAEEWFGDIKILDGEKNPYEYTQDISSHKAKYYVYDTAGRNDTYINALQGNVPDSAGTKIYAVYEYDSYTERLLGWNSVNTLLPAVLSAGTQGREIVLEARYDTGDYTQIQSYDLEFVRVPTLSCLEVFDGQTQILKEYSPTKSVYDIAATGDSLTVKYSAFSKDYTVDVIGAEDNVINISEISSGTAEVCVKSGNGENTYTLNITKAASAVVTAEIPQGVQVRILNTAGSEVIPSEDGTYALVAGEEYTCIGTKDTYYHTETTFTAEDKMMLPVSEPDTEDALSEFAVYNFSNASTRYAYGTDTEFDPADHGYVMYIDDSISSAYAQATARNGYDVFARYLNQNSTSPTVHGQESSVLIDQTVSSSGRAKVLKNLVAKSGYSQILTISLEKTEEDVKYIQEYVFDIVRKLNLSSLAPADEGILFMNEDNTGQVTFDYRVREYYVYPAAGTEYLNLSGTFPCAGDATLCCGGYYIKAGDKEYSDISSVSIPLDVTKQTEEVVITVCHEDPSAVPGEYTIHVVPQEPVNVRFAVTPSDAVIFIKNNITGKRIAGKNGVYALNPGSFYTYTITKNGYKGIKNTSYQAPAEDCTIDDIILEEVAESDFEILDSWWSSLRADKNNNGIISGRTPASSDEAVLYWATKIGSGYDKNACGCPIIVDGYLYTYAGDTIYKVDTVSGQIIQTGKMSDTSSFAVNPPTYAEGMLFLGLAEGTVQAFDAVSLESVWIYHDELGGQPNCPIYYHDGYIYTGFWKGENTDANYVCLSVSDEDPQDTLENKIPTWTYTSKGGFYWAGAHVRDNFGIIGTDDGEGGCLTGKAKVITFSTKSGEIIDEITMPHTGDIRSSMVYDAQSGEYYFTSKGGYFYGLKTDEYGNIIDDSLRYIRLTNGSEISTSPAMSTCSPAVYNKRAYVGVSGISQFGAYSGHNISVLDLKNWEIAYTVPTQGYPQTSGIVSTAYEEEDGCVYVYFVDNYTPGKLRVLKDRENQTKPENLVVEVAVSGGKETEYEVGEVLFTPDGDQAQYAICSPVVDEYGTIYFKNDSSYLMAVGSTIKSLDVTSLPEKTEYDEGEIFDGTGMKVSATYSNSLTRDVTNYVMYSVQPLTADDTSLQIRFENVMYKDSGGNAGCRYNAPTTFVSLTINSEEAEFTAKDCDINGDGKVNADDLSAVLSDYTLDGSGDINGDGTVDSADISIVLDFYSSVVTQ